MSAIPPVSPAAGGAAREPAGEREQLREAAEAFESILVQQLFRRMREAQLDKGFFGESAGASTYESIFEEHLSVLLSEGSPFGVADLLEAQWLEREQDRRRTVELLRRAESLRSSPVIEAALERLGASHRAPAAPAGGPAQVPYRQADERGVQAPSASPVGKENHEDP